MKTDLDPASGRPVRGALIPAWTCVLINLAAFPGLGTILARRRGGYGQAAIMVIGFVLTMAFLTVYLMAAVELLRNPSLTEDAFAARYRPRLWALYDGLGLCAVAWLWSLFSSLQILRDGR